ncbi:ATP-binding cassette domain-containing protein [Enterococcus saccharolyticus]|uniref:Metal ABC transporter ATP-binding protein n=1 Tax=Candidatus Enterococcus willemsii TaxID=1857215 RepID=A0ABQ6YWS5_9ENTE|nr:MULTISPECIES: ATP-binding cassette domain-containing protein [Enterococcus]KAF1302070.1 metal ABC transporter ATP-binding protein [Enterococcus sp. CU12B]MCD5002822.1 ATP-binding cassette domain-containing protein [Enterococcus saccharolyticus]
MYTLEHVSKVYEETIALQDISFSVQQGEIVGVVGKSGSGKSTLLRLLNLLETPTEGRLVLADKDVTQLSKKEIQQQKQKIGMVFQQYNLLNNLTVKENVALPLKLIGVKDEEKVLELLSFVGMAHKKDSYPAQLSGGEKQRVALARALTRNPDVLLCDEATSSLDEENTDDVIRLLQQIHQEFPVTIFFVSHELDTVKKLCERVLVMEDSRLLGTVENQPTLLEKSNQPYLEKVQRRLAK